MWCDNCLLLLPLRAGGIAWAAILFIYSVAGGLFLFMDGQFLFFVYPEWQIYGGISIAIGVLALVTALAFSNRSYIWTRAAKFIWPFVIVLTAVRAIIIIVELQRGKSKIIWECNNGGQLWTESAASGYGTSTSFPSGFCTAGFKSLNTAWIIALLVDLVFQFYMFFLTWRFSKRLEHYNGMKGPFHGGYYA